MSKIITAAAVAFMAMAGAAQAATLTPLNGTFSVRAINVQNVNASQSQATKAIFDLADAGNLGGSASNYAEDTFFYTGDLVFGTNNGSNTTISDWLLTGANGAVSGLDASFGALKQSKGNVLDNSNSGTTTFYLFQLVNDISSGSFNVIHDDGIAILENGLTIGGTLGPTSQTTTNVAGFNGGVFSLLYVATNSDPSILNVETSATVAPVPVPAPLALLASALAGLGLLRRRRAA